MSLYKNTKFTRVFEFDKSDAMIDENKSGILDEFTPDTVRDRWGEAVDAGFVPVPNMLLRAQAKLKLSPTTVIVLLNIMLHWWQRDRLPFPRSTAIAKRSGLSLRTVQRSIRDLEKKGLIARVRNGRKGPARYDLTGLRKLLEEQAREDSWYRPEKVRNASKDRRIGEAERPNLVT